jgi:hypothetical protein
MTEICFVSGWIREEEESRGHCQAGPGVSERREIGEGEGACAAGPQRIGLGRGKAGSRGFGPSGQNEGESCVLFFLSFI